jgi:DNA-binding NarL/FixJ family response regulator
MARILVIDDQSNTAQGTGVLLEQMGHAARACDYIEDLPHLQATHAAEAFQVVLLDLVFVGQHLDVLDALQILASWTPPPPVVILTAGGESRRHFIEAALEWPTVRGGIPKAAPADQLQLCINTVLANGEHYDHEIAAYRPPSHRPPADDLLSRNLHAQIWFALAHGYTSHEDIAAYTGHRPKTIQNAIRHMGDTLANRGLATKTHPTLADLIHYAARHHEYFTAMERRHQRQHPPPTI